MSSTPPPPPAGVVLVAATPHVSTAPDWVRELGQKYKLRALDWSTQAWGLFVAPRRFMEEWVTRRREALAPTRFYAFGTATMFLFERAGSYLVQVKHPEQTWWRAMFHSFFFMMFAAGLMGAAMHVILRIKSREPLRATVAATMFASAGPVALWTCAGWLISVALYFAHGSVPMMHAGSASSGYEAVDVPWPAYAGSLLALPWTIAAQAGVHRVRWWWALLAAVVGPMLLGLVLGVGAMVVIFAWKRWH